MAQANFNTIGSSYPENLDQHKFWNCNLSNYRRRLADNDNELFDELNACLKLLQLDYQARRFQSWTVSTSASLLQALTEYSSSTEKPKCQHFFVHAKHAKAKLKITGSMCRMLLSHHEVMPMFLDFLFPFKRQDHKKEFDFTGFRAFSSWADAPLRPSINVEHLASHQLQICYNLRCIERTPKPAEWPWSMRQTAVFHSFDLESGDAVWINLKGSTEISPRIENLCQSSAPSDPAHFLDAAGALQSALITHLAYCQWAGENWADYVGFLEDRLQDQTRYALLADIPRPKTPEPGDVGLGRAQTDLQPVTRRSTISSINRAARRTYSWLRDSRGVNQAGPTQPAIPEATELEEREAVPEDEESVVEDFTYDDLRQIQYIEDRANGTVLVLKSNISIIGDLAGYYKELKDSQEFQNAFGSRSDATMQHFLSRINSLINNLKLHQARVESLLQLLADRKALLLQLLAHRNMSVSKDMTLQSHESAKKMEKLTKHMEQIALKTEKETIFMRIVTVLTFFFLPGTFVATLMSTDIMKFQSNSGKLSMFSWQALIAYLGITLPIMGFMAWLVVWYRKREQKKLKLKRLLAEKADPETGLSVNA